MKQKILLILLGFCIGVTISAGSRIHNVESNAFPKRMQPYVGFQVPIKGPFVIHREGYSVCYDGRTKNPIWVYEYITLDNLVGDAKRSNNFRCDPEIKHHVQSSLSDFKRSGYDRGHMAAAGNHKDSYEVMDETFYLTNISPQVGVGFNRGIWRQLEQQVRDKIATCAGAHIFTGPLYLAETNSLGERLVSYPVIGNDVAVPTHFFKAIFYLEEGSVEEEAFVILNVAFLDDTLLDSFRVSLRKVEALAGVIFDTQAMLDWVHL